MIGPRLESLSFVNWPNKDCDFGINIMEASDIQTEGGRGRVSTGSTLAVSTPKFKRRSVSAVKDFPLGYGRVTVSNYCLTMSVVRDFSPGCRRVTASNYDLTRQITIDHSSEGK
ncbi:hypothetical protein J1N35_043920 [Gossypium stocksii]|uniref:Uncharacterized protein n=1 Tax=Gossypium stocksii TaxID=47602 RepID=A0A9D3ZFI4_9ROSI|nr:hypothetical protein J1N35_043920 [Gossypium stocksii]